MECWASAWAAMSSRVMPPRRLMVPVKYVSMTSRLLPKHSKNWLPREDCTEERPLLEAIVTMPWRMAWS